jgi:hypothetical protein
MEIKSTLQQLFFILKRRDSILVANNVLKHALYKKRQPVYTKIYEGKKKDTFVWNVGLACRQLWEGMKCLPQNILHDGVTGKLAGINLSYDQL